MQMRAPLKMLSGYKLLGCKPLDTGAFLRCLSLKSCYKTPLLARYGFRNRVEISFTPI